MSSKFTIAAAVAFGALMSTAMTAQAADLGGDCCADLEERVAVLEATTARKGNRKVSLEIYGHVNKALLIWDNGVDDDAYVVDNDHRSTRLGFKGKAKINSDWEAGYKIEIQLENASTGSVDETTDDDPDEITIRKSYLYLKSKQYGALSLGHNSVASDDVTHDGFVSKTTDHVRPDWHYIRNFNLIDSTTGTKVQLGGQDIDWGTACGAAMSDDDACFDIGSRRDSIRYDSPTIAGFKLSAAWGEDDFWDVALRYAGEFGDFHVKAAVGYAEWDSNNTGGGEEDNALDEESWAASAGIIHTPTGLFVQGSYRDTEVTHNNGFNADSQAWYVQGGVSQKWNTLGKTVIWGEYAEAEDGVLTGKYGEEANTDGVTGSEITRWGVGITQFIDAAKMQVYVIYQHNEAELDNYGASLEDFDNVVVGGSIRF